MSTTNRPISVSCRAAIAAAALVVLWAAPAAAQVRAKGLTGGLETSNRFVTLPDAPRGSLFVRECGECPSVRLEFDAGTRFFVGEEPVTYARLLEASGEGDAGLLVSYRLGTRTITRLRLSAGGN